MSLKTSNQKSGNELLQLNNHELDFSLIDFWRWSTSDILSNATRGRFAEFIVATAMNIDLTGVREEWSDYDLETSEKIKLEIKSSAYIQSWNQDKISRISFSIKPAAGWNNSTNRRLEIKQRQADVYVFCILNHIERETINPLNLNQWEFYVLSTSELNKFAKSQRSISISKLKKLTTAVNYDKISNTIKSLKLFK